MLGLARVAIQWAAVALGAVPSSQLLFTLGRTTNANIVEYAVRLDAGRIAGPRAFDVHWRMLATDGHLEGLSFFEQRLAYGLSSQSVGNEVYELRLVSCPNRKIVVRQAGEAYEAETSIGGVPSKLTGIFVRADAGALGPQVKAVELSGTSLKDGTATFERLAPKVADETASRYDAAP